MLIADTAQILNVIAPVVVSALGVLAIIVIVMTKHQRKMAEILRQPASQPDSLVEEVRSMRAELRRLEAKVDAMAEPQDLSRRLSGPPPVETQSLG